ncbi:hypothetical protein SapgrDRAFT_2508 [Saprospira grandis DSM 2844]|uniref:Uncharacterized protein n=1 Tax=Saprospira grandis DSM 2844 TaxID=694433 RepID=J0P9C6_9BACT|nr:hypothetical protein [Saprospira grandis]EJF54167.1 hypothetical protein SapgrDRAFT_2508 [Saprospira grandis DSM 2844]
MTTTLNLDPLAEDLISIENRVLDSVLGVCLIFKEPVVFRNMVIGQANFYESFFKKGLLVSNCVIGNVIFESAGHNDEPIVFENTVFTGDVNFFDAYFTSDIVIRNCLFVKPNSILEDIAYPYGVEKKEYLKIESK